MDTTASSFTLRKNAKRAAEAMIRKGAAPAVEYGIRPSDDGRFEIVWKSVKAAPTSDEVETEIAEPPANQPAAASPSEAASQPAPAATELATTDAAPQPASEVEAASQPGPAATDPAPALSEPAPKNELATRHPRDGAQAQILAGGNHCKPPRSRSLARRISRRRLRHVPGSRHPGLRSGARCDARQAAPACHSDGAAKVVAVEICHRP